MNSKVSLNTAKDLALNDYRAEFQTKLIKAGHWQSCLNCAHYAANVCEFYNAEPPIVIVVVGCKEHEQVIPF